MTEFATPAAARWLDDAPTAVAIEHGPWRMDRVGAGLADIRFRGVSVLRALRVVVRDADWRTIEPRDVVVTGGDGGSITIAARCQRKEVDFAWTATLSLDDTELRVDLSGVAQSAFERNRIGIIVLHWPSDAGSQLWVTHPDGTSTRTRFPDAIAPHQPALDIAGLEWSRQGIDVRLHFAGDVFEMEDQRNWTDASFKTYSTPLERPFPVRLDPGDRVAQSVTVTCDGDPESGAGDDAPEREEVVLGAERVFPQVGIAASTASVSSRPRDVVRAPVTLVELDVRDANWRAALERARQDAGKGLLDVRLIARDEADVAQLVDAVAPLPIARLAVFDATTHVSEPVLWRVLGDAAAARGIRGELVAGTRAHFTELNRTHERLPDAPLTFSITPQMHDIERAQIVESIAMQRLVAENAVRIADGAAVHVGPVTLRARYNAVATTPYAADRATDVSGGYGAERVAEATDARQTSPAMAAWVMASTFALAIDNVASITLGEAWGPRGLADETGRFPVADAAELLIARGGELTRRLENLPDGCWGAAFPERREMLVANVADDDARFTIEGVGALVVPATDYVRQAY
ncbi:hypothetical protein [Paramicrobacterium agarici]|uniref:hypothetical protein n=1 Tax=Paramicrobacterium agarici TaxID=630514 RepID=UPI0011527A25|nr:hypothetical protein [Microbacterium agarici]TQO21872.1 hypothetical protein FB385_0684 [Microbacterium agarici]